MIFNRSLAATVAVTLSYGTASAADLATINGATFTQSVAQIGATYEAQGYRCERLVVMVLKMVELMKRAARSGRRSFPFPTRIRVRCGPCAIRKTTRC